MTYLFSVEDRFSIEGRGTILAPGISRSSELPIVRDGAKIQLRKPDLTIVDTFIKALEMIRYRPDISPEKRTTPILLPKNLHKFDIPIGTEVFLVDDEKPACATRYCDESSKNEVTKQKRVDPPDCAFT